MSESKMNGLKRSEVLKIEAAIVEIMESAKFEVTNDVLMTVSKTSGFCQMSFPKSVTSLEELNLIKEKLGKDFSITISAKDKSQIFVCIEAPEEAFISMLDNLHP